MTWLAYDPSTFIQATRSPTANPLTLAPICRTRPTPSNPVYGQKEPKVLVRVVGQAPLAATVYSLERLRCGACGQVFTPQEPEGVGLDKYDETAVAMIAQL